MASDSQITRELNSSNRNRPQISNPKSEIIVEAQGWYKDAQGNIILTTQATSVTPHSNWENSPNCPAPTKNYSSKLP